MSTSEPHVSSVAPAYGHFADIEQQTDASALGMWLFLVTELMFFGGLFLVYTIYRDVHFAAFAAGSQHLDIVLGTANTAILIGSSLTMALAVRSAATGRRQAITYWLSATILLGATFLGIKGIEYAAKFHHHLVPGAGFHFDGPYAHEAQMFFSLYFVMTGLHATHMVIGIPIIAIIAFKAWRGHYSAIYHAPVEYIGLYWHFVDIVWIFLFPLLYLIERHPL
jgi:cytochrome c oxidase subunit 3